MIAMNEDKKEKLKDRIFKTSQQQYVDGAQLIQVLKHDSSMFLPNRIIFNILKTIQNKEFAYKSFDEYFRIKDSVKVDEYPSSEAELGINDVLSGDNEWS